MSTEAILKEFLGKLVEVSWPATAKERAAGAPARHYGEGVAVEIYTLDDGTLMLAVDDGMAFPVMPNGLVREVPLGGSPNDEADKAEIVRQQDALRQAEPHLQQSVRSAEDYAQRAQDWAAHVAAEALTAQRKAIAAWRIAVKARAAKRAYQERAARAAERFRARGTRQP